MKEYNVNDIIVHEGHAYYVIQKKIKKGVKDIDGMKWEYEETIFNCQRVEHTWLLTRLCTGCFYTFHQILVDHKNLSKCVFIPEHEFKLYTFKQEKLLRELK